MQRHIDPEDLALYAMQLLPADEAAAVELHLQHNPAARAEVAAIQGDLAAFAFTAEMHSPPALSRTRLLKKVARERKAAPMRAIAAPPIVHGLGSGTPAAATVEENDGVTASIGAYQRGGGAAAASVFSYEAEASRPSLVSRVLPWAGWAIAAGLAVSTTNFYMQRESLKSAVASDKAQIEQSAAEAASAREVLNAMNDQAAMRVTLRKPFAPVTPTGRTTYSAEKGVLIFQATNLDPIDTYKVYELWIIPADGKAPIPAGTFHPDAQGYANFVLTNLPKGVEAKAFGITVENEGGSKVPTPPVLMTGA